MSNGLHPNRAPALRLVAGLALLVSTPALAQEGAVGQGYSIDIEFLRPSFGHRSFAGVDVPMAYRDLTIRAGMLMQYEQAPLTLYEAVTQEELGAVVTNRFSGMVGASLDVNRVTFGVLVPTALNWGTERPTDFGADGFGIADIGATARLIVVQTPRDFVNLGIRGGLILPTGRPESYIGEGQLRANAGLVAATNLGPVTVASDLGLMTREVLPTDEDFTAANEITWGNALRYRLPAATRTALNGQLLARAGMQDFLRGGAENALELIGGAEFYPTRRTTIGVGIGRGLTEGYGTTDVRILSNLIVEIPPPDEPPMEYVQEIPLPPPEEPPPPPVIIEDPPVEFGEELAVQVKDRIYIRDMLEFHVDTADLKEESVPTLQAVAKIINENPYIANLTIEGHASQEGDFRHNYQLAESRARAVWELMLIEGVASERINYRGLGEIKPIKGEVGQEDLDEEALQTNRRVEFHIVRQFEGVDEMPDYPESQYLPWNGEVVPVVAPPKPVLEEPEGEGRAVDEFGIPIDDDIDIGAPPSDEGGGE